MQNSSLLMCKNVRLKNIKRGKGAAKAPFWLYFKSYL